MSEIGLTYDGLKELAPCKERLVAVRKLMGGAKTWNGRIITAQEARDAGASFEDLVWAASAVARRNPDVERRLRLWMADCAARVLHIYEREAPGDDRVRAAIVAARQFARSEIDAAARAAARAAAWDAARDAAWDAARDAAWAAASAAARAAAWDAASDAAWDAASDAARAAARAAASDAAWDAASDAARAAARAAAWAAARAAEEEWQFTRLVAWMSDPEPQDWPLDAPVQRAA